MNKKIYIAVAVVILVAVGFLMFGRGKKNPQATTESQNQSSTSQSSNNSDTTASSGTTVSGVLRVSNNKARGNLMIVSSNQTVYLNTKRDFSALVGKNVTATIDGNLNSFSLVNMVAAQ